MPEERLAGARRLHTEQARLASGHEGVRNAPQRQSEVPSPDAMLHPALDVHDNLAFEHVEHLVGVGVGVEGRHLALLHVVFEEEEGAVRLLGGGLPGV